MNRYFSSFMATALIYSLIFSTLLYSIDVDKKVNSQPKQNLNNIKFTVLEQRKPHEQKKVEKKKQLPKEIVKKEPVKKAEPKKIIKKEPVKRVVKKELPKKIIPKKKIVKKEKPEKTIKEPVKKIVKKQKLEPVEKIVKKEPLKKEKEPKQQKIVKQQIKQQKKIVKKVDKSIDEEVIKAKKNLYFKFIKDAIAKNKQYPRIAARRGIEGDVKVNFTISKTGELLKYDIVHGHRIFKRSIIKAFTKTFPVKPPKDIFLSNTKLSITIAYRLN